MTKGTARVMRKIMMTVITRLMTVANGDGAANCPLKTRVLPWVVAPCVLH